MTLSVLAVRQPLDEGLFADQVAAEAALLGVEATLSWDNHVVIPPPDTSVVLTTPEMDDLVHAPPGTVRLDLGERAPDRTPNLLAHIQARGIIGVRWAMRTVVHHERWPSQRVSYGRHWEQFGELWLPEGDAPAPVVVLVHGGYWRSKWQLDLMDALAVDLAQRGFAAWNVEYRRPDRHGWTKTCADVSAAIEHVASLPGVDPAKVAVVGHSAGGQLGACAVINLTGIDVSVRPSVLVVQAGVMDIDEAARRHLGEGAVAAALGGTQEQLAERYLSASPIDLLPSGAHQVVVTARGDSLDLNDMNVRYADLARRAGDEVTELQGDGDHFTLIDPHSTLWADTVAVLTAQLRQGES